MPSDGFVEHVGLVFLLDERIDTVEQIHLHCKTFELARARARGPKEASSSPVVFNSFQIRKARITPLRMW